MDYGLAHLKTLATLCEDLTLADVHSWHPTLQAWLTQCLSSGLPTGMSGHAEMLHDWGYPPALHGVGDGELHLSAHARRGHCETAKEEPMICRCCMCECFQARFTFLCSPPHHDHIIE
jgi:hypothetical protein